MPGFESSQTDTLDALPRPIEDHRSEHWRGKNLQQLGASDSLTFCHL